MKLAISFDYDSPEGYRNSFGMQGWPADADQQGTDVLLRVLKERAALATFGVVGRVALDGIPPEHCPEQVRRIHHDGHEVASHSMFHRFLPPLRRNELLEDAATSRKVLETASMRLCAASSRPSIARCISRSAGRSASANCSAARPRTRPRRASGRCSASSPRPATAGRA